MDSRQRLLQHRLCITDARYAGGAGVDGFDIDAALPFHHRGWCRCDTFNINTSGGVGTGLINGQVGADVITVADAYTGTVRGGSEADTITVSDAGVTGALLAGDTGADTTTDAGGANTNTGGGGADTNDAAGGIDTITGFGC